ncbi:MAG: hypothetical protein NC411_10310 [Bacteroides sp.]|nr:hypothetical protein [Bacteroides sp.]
MERLFKAHLVEFDLSLRILIPLEKAGIRTLGDLCRHTRAEVGQIRNIEAVSVKTLEAFLRSQDLSFVAE